MPHEWQNAKIAECFVYWRELAVRQLSHEIAEIDQDTAF